MRKSIETSVLLFLLVVLVLVGYVSATSTVTKDMVFQQAYSSDETTCVITTDLNDVTIPLGVIQGKVTGIVISTTATDDYNDTDFTVTLLDEDTNVLFTKTDCNSLALPYRYAVSTADTSANDFLGAPVSGVVSVQIADANGGDLNSLTVKVYYDETIR